MSEKSSGIAFKKILIANRSEIACRVIKTCQKMGIATVAVHSDADKDALFVKMADEAVHIGASSPAESYLNVDAILKAAKETGAEAIHPGYGFLSESVVLVEACKKNDLVFIGPGTDAISLMGKKIEAKEAMENAGVPVVPGSDGALSDEDEAAKVAEEIGFPVMLKASAGGGGIGMYACKKEKKLRKSFEDAQQKGERFFGSSEVFLEKLIVNPHHIEVQILADTHGNVRHLRDRECSVQRRHQKVLEEAPSPFLKDEVREELCATAVKAAEAVGYVGAGTVEFIVDDEQNFYFLEMNTRLQVEHPVTEMILGMDLVQWQLKIAAGEAIDFTQDDVKPEGHAIELRLCAEDPDKRFMPCPGTLTTVTWPSGEGIRVDTGVKSGSEITPYYDSMFAKLIAHGRTRNEAIARLQKAVAETTLEGIATSLSLHKRVLHDETFQKGVYDTGYLANVLNLKA
ncbi:MAG: acetyl-CoA carboxylase biotin carboxylase subunit [Deltaproteobacteria bacterium]|nr:acetyl-CoA carboxylase biotin carboxylase subunit [Deltaproteobacteria bacterium]